MCVLVSKKFQPTSKSWHVAYGLMTGSKNMFYYLLSQTNDLWYIILHNLNAASQIDLCPVLSVVQNLIINLYYVIKLYGKGYKSLLPYMIVQ